MPNTPISSFLDSIEEDSSPIPPDPDAQRAAKRQRKNLAYHENFKVIPQIIYTWSQISNHAIQSNNDFSKTQKDNAREELHKQRNLLINWRDDLEKFKNGNDLMDALNLSDITDRTRRRLFEGINDLCIFVNNNPHWKEALAPDGKLDTLLDLTNNLSYSNKTKKIFVSGKNLKLRQAQDASLQSDIDSIKSMPFDEGHQKSAIAFRRTLSKSFSNHIADEIAEKLNGISDSNIRKNKLLTIQHVYENLHAKNLSKNIGSSLYLDNDDEGTIKTKPGIDNDKDVAAVKRWAKGNGNKRSSCELFRKYVNRELNQTIDNGISLKILGNYMRKQYPNSKHTDPKTAARNIWSHIKDFLKDEYDIALEEKQTIKDWAKNYKVSSVYASHVEQFRRHVNEIREETLNDIHENDIVTNYAKEKCGKDKTKFGQTVTAIGNFYKQEYDRDLATNETSKKNLEQFPSSEASTSNFLPTTEEEIAIPLSEDHSASLINDSDDDKNPDFSPFMSSSREHSLSWTIVKDAFFAKNASGFPHIISIHDADFPYAVSAEEPAGYELIQLDDKNFSVNYKIFKEMGEAEESQHVITTGDLQKIIDTRYDNAIFLEQMNEQAYGKKPPLPGQDPLEQEGEVFDLLPSRPATAALETARK